MEEEGDARTLRFGERHSVRPRSLGECQSAVGKRAAGSPWAQEGEGEARTLPASVHPCEFSATFGTGRSPEEATAGWSGDRRSRRESWEGSTAPALWRGRPYFSRGKSSCCLLLRPAEPLHRGPQAWRSSCGPPPTIQGPARMGEQEGSWCVQFPVRHMPVLQASDCGAPFQPRSVPGITPPGEGNDA